MRVAGCFRKNREWLVYLAIVALFSIIVPITTIYHIRNGEATLEKSLNSNLNDSSNFTVGLVVLAAVTNVDPNSYSYRVTILLKPYGALAKFPTVDMFDFSSAALIPSATFNVSINGKLYTLPAGSPIAQPDLNLFFYKGEPASYPWDVCK